MQSTETKVIRILERVRDFFPNGIQESKLPGEDHLVMYRLTSKFLKATDVLETGENIFAITEAGLQEAGRGRSN